MYKLRRFLLKKYYSRGKIILMLSNKRNNILFEIPPDS